MSQWSRAGALLFTTHPQTLYPNNPSTNSTGHAAINVPATTPPTTPPEGPANEADRSCLGAVSTAAAVAAAAAEDAVLLWPASGGNTEGCKASKSTQAQHRGKLGGYATSAHLAWSCVRNEVQSKGKADS
jgi:hypothetical protein